MRPASDLEDVAREARSIVAMLNGQQWRPSPSFSKTKRSPPLTLLNEQPKIDPLLARTLTAIVRSAPEVVSALA